MLLNETEVKERMESPLNLLNRLREVTTSSKNKSTIVSIPPTVEKLIEDVDEKLAVGTLKSKASRIMISAMDELERRIPEVQKPERLAQIAAEMNKVVTAKDESRSDEKERAQFHVFAPQFVNENHYETIHVRE